MLTTLLLLLVPTTALGLVLGLGRLEDSLLRAPGRHAGPAELAATTEGVAP